jgi:ribonuclease HII
MLALERRLWSNGYERIAGLDEAGRGCLAGPVVAAAVILPPEQEMPAAQDSKSLSEAERLEARARIESEAVAWAVGLCSPEEIDDLNILWASLRAMQRAAVQCQPAPDFLLVDGNRWIADKPLLAAAEGSPQWPYQTVVKGDATSQSIAAASIIAKTERDALMRALHNEHPAYGWNTNVGYPTQQHYAALAKHGATPVHRQSFTLFRD